MIYNVCWITQSIIQNMLCTPCTWKTLDIGQWKQTNKKKINLIYLFVIKFQFAVFFLFLFVLFAFALVVVVVC